MVACSVDAKKLSSPKCGRLPKNIKSVASGALVPPKYKRSNSEPITFVIPLGDYDLPANMSSHLRITQIMGTLTQPDMTVWTGMITSPVIEYCPNQRMELTR